MHYKMRFFCIINYSVSLETASLVLGTAWGPRHADANYFCYLSRSHFIVRQYNSLPVKEVLLVNSKTFYFRSARLVSNLAHKIAVVFKLIFYIPS